MALTNSEHCEHRYLTVYPGSGGWVCADCRVGILSLAVPLPMPLIEKAFAALSTGAAS